MESKKQSCLGCLSTVAKEGACDSYDHYASAEHAPLPNAHISRKRPPHGRWSRSRRIADWPPASGLRCGRKHALTAAATIRPVRGNTKTQEMLHGCKLSPGYQLSSGGGVTTDADNHYVSTFSAPLLNCFSPLMAKAYACKEVLSWLRGRDEDSIRLHTDCPTLPMRTEYPVQVVVCWICY